LTASGNIFNQNRPGAVNMGGAANATLPLQLQQKYNLAKRGDQERLSEHLPVLFGRDVVGGSEVLAALLS